jgi:hypothetical protein
LNHQNVLPAMLVEDSTDAFHLRAASDIMD